jgi:hypothetical protein
LSDCVHCHLPILSYRTFNSTREKPRPARTRRLYLMVGQRTTGRSLSTGRGASLAALSWRALRLRILRPGYSKNWMSGHCCALQAPLLSGREGNYLVEVHADTALPVLAEICKELAMGILQCASTRVGISGLTVVLDLLVVLDRLIEVLAYATLPVGRCVVHTILAVGIWRRS